MNRENGMNATLAETYGAMPALQPLTPAVRAFTSPEALAALGMTQAQGMAEFGPQETADEVSDPGATDDAPAFVPDTKEKADWVLREIADARARAARIRENAERMARQEEAEAERLEWQFGPALQDLARRELSGGRRKSLTLYHGVLGFKSKPASVQIGDPKAALAWAKANLPGAVVETFDRAAVTKALLTTGESVDFAAFTPAEEQFYIR